MINTSLSFYPHSFLALLGCVNTEDKHVVVGEDSAGGGGGGVVVNAAIGKCVQLNKHTICRSAESS